MDIDKISRTVTRKGAIKALVGGIAAAVGLAKVSQTEAATCSRWYSIPTNGALNYAYYNWLAEGCSFTSQGCYCGVAAWCTTGYPSNTPRGTVLYGKPWNVCPF